MTDVQREGFHSAEARSDTSGLTLTLRTFVLLGAVGASVGLFAWALNAGRWLSRLVAQNHLSAEDRSRALASVALGALLPLIVAGGTLVHAWRRGRAHSYTAQLNRIWLLARVGTPALLLWAMPPLFSWRAWVGQDILFLLTTALVAGAFEQTLRVSLTAINESPSLQSYICSMRALLGTRSTKLVPPLVAGCIAGYLIYVGYYSVLQNLTRQTTGFDLGGYGTFFWNTIHGRPFYCPIFHPRDTLYLMIHAEPAVYLLAPAYALYPGTSALLVIQTLLLGLSAIPLYLFARRRLASGHVAGVLALSFLLFPALHLSNFYDFHFLTISTFFILWAVFFFEANRPVAFWLSVLAALMCREDVSVGGTFVGLGLLLGGVRPRTGAALAILSASYFIVTKFFIMPLFGDPSFVHHYQKLVAPGERGFSGVLQTLLTNPTFTLNSVLVPEKLPLTLHLLVPLAFLPVRKLRYAFLLLGGMTVVLLSTEAPPVVDIRYQYTSHFTPYLFVAAALTLNDIGVSRGLAARTAAVGAICLATILVTARFGALNQGAFVAGHGKVVFQMTEQHISQLRNLREIAETIPPGAKLAATERDAPHLTEREHLFTLKYADQSSDVDYMLYGYDDLDYGAARQVVRDALRRGTYGLHAERPGYVVLRRGAQDSHNGELLSKL